MTKYFLSLAALLLAAPAPAAQMPRAEITGNTYIHQLYDDETCREIRESGGIFNCRQRIELHEEGRVLAMWTDIMNIGTWERQGNEVHLTFPDAGRTITMKVARSGFTLVDENRKAWVLSGRCY